VLCLAGAVDEKSAHLAERFFGKMANPRSKKKSARPTLSARHRSKSITKKAIRP